MSRENNALTRQVLANEIKVLQAKCKEHCFIIDNNQPMELGTITPENYNHRKLSYIQSLTNNIKNEETPIITDSNLNTSQFLNEITEKILHIEELTAFTRGAVQDVERENERLRVNIKLVEVVKSRPLVQRKVQPEHLQQAKYKFRTMKAVLHGLVHSLFPGSGDAITDFLGELMGEVMCEMSGGYIKITEDNYHLVELLKDENIVSINPYNNMEVKLAF